MGGQQGVKTYRHIVWDWNGTLMNDLDLCLDIINQMLARRGLSTVDLVRYREVFGFPLRDYCARVGFNLMRDPFEILSDEFNESYEEKRYNCPLHDGVLDRLAELNERGIQHTVLSAYGQEKLCEIIEFYGLTSQFYAVLGLDNSYGEGKVERGRRCMQEMDWIASEMLYVGDTLHDSEVAEAMGIDCMLIAHGHQSRQRLLQAGCPVIERLSEVPSFVLPRGKRRHG